MGDDISGGDDGATDPADGPGGSPPPDPDRVLASALGSAALGEQRAELVTLRELADRAEVPVSVLEALEREGLLVPQTTGEPVRYAAGDATVVRDGMRLLEAGLPLGELLELARRTDRALREVADHAVDLFARFVRDPIRGQADTPEAAAEELLEAFRSMLPATGTLVSHHFRRLVVARARQRLADDLSVPTGDALPPEPPDETPDDTPG